VAEPPDAAPDAAADEAGAAADELDELDELQAAAVRATTAATITTDPGRRKRRNAPSPCRPEYGPLFSVLLLSLIPCPSTLMQPDESMRDTIQHVCPVRQHARVSLQGNARCAQRNVLVNTFLKPLKKG
jgi:hypothetical protein